MSSGKVFLKCDISLGPFSGERVFELSTTGGQVYSGIAPVGYCFNGEGEPYRPNEPALPEIGRLQARLIRNGGSSSLVSVPDGESLRVPTELILT
jgi:hypothetical protein